jgi:hypothetical protein
MRMPRAADQLSRDRRVPVPTLEFGDPWARRSRSVEAHPVEEAPGVTRRHVDDSFATLSSA